MVIVQSQNQQTLGGYTNIPWSEDAPNRYGITKKDCHQSFILKFDSLHKIVKLIHKND